MAGRFSVETVFKLVDRITGPVRRMQSRVGRFTRSMERGFRRASMAVSSMTAAMRAGATRMALGAAVALAALSVAINKVADDADSLAKASRRLAFPIEELQEWRFVAEQSGVSAELLDKSLGAFAKRIGEARAGIGPMITGLKKSNPELLKQLLATDNVADALELYLNTMRDTPNALDRAALASTAFSRAGLKMANIVDNSAAAVARLRAEQRKNGVITMEQAESAEAFNDAMNSLKRAMTGFMQEALLPLMPHLEDGAQRLRDWVTEAGGAVVVSEKLTEAVRFMIDDFSTLVDWLKKIGIGIAVFLALDIALKAITLTMTLFNLVIAANPFVLLGIAIVAAAALIILNWEPIKQFFVDLWDTIKQIVTAPFPAVTGLGKLFGLGGDGADGADGAQMTSPQARTARSIEEKSTTSTAEVTLRDETGRAEVTKGKLGGGLTLEPSGAF